MADVNGSRLDGPSATRVDEAVRSIDVPFYDIARLIVHYEVVVCRGTGAAPVAHGHGRGRDHIAYEWFVCEELQYLPSLGRNHGLGPAMRQSYVAYSGGNAVHRASISYVGPRAQVHVLRPLSGLKERYEVPS